jgi:hypothetical protein
MSCISLLRIGYKFSRPYFFSIKVSIKKVNTIEIKNDTNNLINNIAIFLFFKREIVILWMCMADLESEYMQYNLKPYKKKY